MNGIQIIRSAHWTDGGTAITNFEPSEVGLYLQAITNLNRPEWGLAVSSLPMATFDNNESYDGGRGLFSFHALSHTGDLSDFWRVFEKVCQAPTPSRSNH